MPRTPPLILPNSMNGNWFNTNGITTSSRNAKEQQPQFQGLDELGLLQAEDISSFSYSPSDDDMLDSHEGASDTVISSSQQQTVTQSNVVGQQHRSSPQDRQHQQQQAQNNDANIMETLFKTSSSQQSTRNIDTTANNHFSNNNSQHYQLVDDDSQPADDTSTRENSTIHHNLDTQSEVDTAVFDSAVEELRNEFKIYTEEYKEFKRYVDNVKRELLAHIQERSDYFEQRGTYLSQKWDSLKQFI